MRVLVCGSRHFYNMALMKEILDEYKIDTVIHGAARGTDTCAGDYAGRLGISIDVYPALWDKYGKSAGPIRNAQMLKEGKPELVIAFRGPNSRGTQNMIDQATKAGVPVQIVEIS